MRYAAWRADVWMLILCAFAIRNIMAAELAYNRASIVTQQPGVFTARDPGTIDYTMYFLDTCFAFDVCGRREGLYDFLFGPVLTIGDIYLPARLASQGILTFASGYGTTPSEQYLAQLAATVVNFTGDYQEWGAIINVGYEVKIPCDIRAQFAFNLPIRDIRKQTFLDFQGGRIMATSVITNPIDNASQYQSDFNGTVEDFFLEGILKPKELTYLPVQHVCGVSDPTLYLTLSHDFVYTTTLAAGIGITCPLTPRPTEKIIDELILGNGGATFIDLFCRIDFDSKEWFLAPSVGLTARLNPTFTTPIRSPSYLSSYSQTVCYAPPTYQTAFTTEPFYELDSTVYQFADAATCAQFKYGTQLTFVLKNVFTLERQKSTFTIGYQYYHSNTAVITHPANGIVYNDSSNPYVGPSHSSTIVWQLAYNASSLVSYNLGGFVVVTGADIYRTYQLYAQWHWAFA